MATGQELQDKGVKLFQQQDLEASAQTFEQARAAYETEGRAEMAAEMQVNLGLVMRSMGENQKALETMQAALAVFQGQNDALRSAKALGNMGGVYSALGDKEQAYHCYREA